MEEFERQQQHNKDKDEDKDKDKDNQQIPKVDYVPQTSENKQSSITNNARTAEAMSDTDEEHNDILSMSDAFDRMEVATAAGEEHEHTSDQQFNPTDLEQQYGYLAKGVSREIYIRGTGNIGKLIAHSLKILPSPPRVTLIFHRKPLIDAWASAAEGKIIINRHGYDIVASGFKVELSKEVRLAHGAVMDEELETKFDQTSQPHELGATLQEDQDLQTFKPSGRSADRYFTDYKHPINHLILTTKITHVLTALLGIKHRLTASSTICFIHNGMGIIDKINEKIFPDPATRPRYILGVISHGVNVDPRVRRANPFISVHAGEGTLALGLLDAPGYTGTAEPRYLLRQLMRCPELVAVTHTPMELLQLQLEKLAINCIINPLTVILDARNGSLLHNYHMRRTMRLMLAEISMVLRSLPELRGLPNVSNRFGAKRLEQMVLNVADATAENISSMLLDVRERRRTEVEYINGYIVRRGEELGIKCVVNYAMMQIVIGKSNMVREEAANDIRMMDEPINDSHI